MTGKEIISFIYDECSVFYQGLSKVKYNGKWGFIDKTGKEIISFIYDECYDYNFHYDCVQVRIGDKWGKVDKIGKEFWYD